MKRLILLASLLVLILSAPSFASTISFDFTGNSSYSLYDTWNLSTIPTIDSNYSTSVPYDIFTYQDIVTGDFTEEFTVWLTSGELNNSETIFAVGSNADFSPIYSLYAEVTLLGNASGSVTFNGGTIEIYDSANNDTLVATLVYQYSLLGDVGTTLLGSGVSLDIDLAFAFDYVNSDYFGADEQSLVDDLWLLSVIGGDLTQAGYTTAGTDYVIAWTAEGGTMEAQFNVVPEPSTYVLLGVGLVGLAFYQRKRSNA